MTSKTINLAGKEIKVEYSSGANAWLRNDGADVIYASASAGISAGADGVISIPAGQAAAVYGANGTVYLLGTGSVLLVGSDYAECPFGKSAQSGGSGADDVARAAINAHAGNADIHVTAAEKSTWNGKAELSDIPVNLHGEIYGSTNKDIFSSNLPRDNPCWNKWVSVSGNADNPEATDYIPNCPETPGEGVWYEVLTGTNDGRAFQIATGCFRWQQSVHIRFCHDGTWSEWRRIPDSTAIDKLEARIAALEGE